VKYLSLLFLFLVQEKKEKRKKKNIELLFPFIPFICHSFSYLIFKIKIKSNILFITLITFSLPTLQQYERRRNASMENLRISV
jgi:hypothetical protein